jgi:hypothetical protein
LFPNSLSLCSSLNVSPIFTSIQNHRQNYNLKLWHVDLLLDNGREITNYTTTVTRQWPANNNRGTMFSVRSVPRCYKQNKL